MLQEYTKDRFLIYVNLNGAAVSLDDDENTQLFYKEIFKNMIFFNDQKFLKATAGNQTVLEAYLGKELAFEVKKKQFTEAKGIDLYHLYVDVCSHLYGARSDEQKLRPLLIIDEAEAFLKEGKYSRITSQLGTGGAMQTIGRGKAVFCTSAEFDLSVIHPETTAASYYDVKPPGRDTNWQVVANAVAECIKYKSDTLKETSKFELFDEPLKDRLTEAWKDRKANQNKQNPGPEDSVFDVSDENIKRVSESIAKRCQGTLKFMFSAIEGVCTDAADSIRRTKSADFEYVVMQSYRCEVDDYLSGEITRQTAKEKLRGLEKNDVEKLFQAVYMGLKKDQHFIPTPFMGLMYKVRADTRRTSKYFFVNPICESIAEDYLLSLLHEVRTYGDTAASGILLEFRLYCRFSRNGIHLEGKNRYFNKNELVKFDLSPATESFAVDISSGKAEGARPMDDHNITFKNPDPLQEWISDNLQNDQSGTAFLRGKNTPGWDIYAIEKKKGANRFKIVLIQITGEGASEEDKPRAIDTKHYQAMSKYTKSTLETLGRLIVYNATCTYDPTNGNYTLTDPDKVVQFDVCLLYVSMRRISIIKEKAHAEKKLGQLIVVSGHNQISNICEFEAYAPH